MYYVIEVQSQEMTGSAIPYSFTSLPDAEEKYHDILRVASKSNVPKHGCVIINDDNFIIKSEVYRHE